MQTVKEMDVEDTLDVFPCHGVGGMVGMFLTGCFANTDIDPTVLPGLFYGGRVLIWRQTVAILGLAVYITVVSFLLFTAVDKTLGLRVTADEERQGMDRTFHGEQIEGTRNNATNAVLGPRPSNNVNGTNNLDDDVVVPVI